MNPNARCPECGSAVFFYQSPAGGRVFFDELGPPWPKHPCTAAGIKSTVLKAAAPEAPPSELKKAKIYKWQRAGWVPFFITSAERSDRYFRKVSGSLNGETFTVFIKRFKDTSIISAECICFARKTGNGKYELSLILPSGTSFKVTAYKSYFEARKDPDAIKKSKRKTQRNSAKKKNQKRYSSKKIKINNSNATSITFSEAQK